MSEVDVDMDNGFDKTEDRPKKRARLEDPDCIAVKILVPQMTVGAVLGKGGQDIIDVQNRFGGKCRMSKTDDFFPGLQKERICLLQGELESVFEIFKYIHSTARTKGDKSLFTDVAIGRPAAPRQRVVKLVVPDTTAGLVIGKGGKFIKELSEQTGAFVNVTQKGEIPCPTGERIVNIEGNEDEVNAAAFRILEQLHKDALHKAHPSLSYHGFSGAPGGGPQFPQQRHSMGPGSGGPPMPNYGDNPAYHQGMQQGTDYTMSHGMDYGHGMQQQQQQQQQHAPQQQSPNYEQLRLLLSSSGFTGNAAEEIITALNILAKYGMLPGIGMNSIGVANMLAALATVGGLSNAQQYNSVQSQLYSALGQPNQPPPPNFPQQSFQPQQQQQGMFNNGNPMMGNFQPKVEVSQITVPDDNGEIISKEIGVEEKLIGVVLGIRGRGLADIGGATGAKIEVSPRNVLQPGTDNRIVTLTGTATQVARGVDMVERRVATEKDSRQRLSGNRR